LESLGKKNRKEKFKRIFALRSFKNIPWILILIFPRDPDNSVLTVSGCEPNGSGSETLAAASRKNSPVLLRYFNYILIKYSVKKLAVSKIIAKNSNRKGFSQLLLVLLTGN